VTKVFFFSLKTIQIEEYMASKTENVFLHSPSPKNLPFVKLVPHDNFIHAPQKKNLKKLLNSPRD